MNLSNALSQVGSDCALWPCTTLLPWVDFLCCWNSFGAYLFTFRYKVLFRRHIRCALHQYMWFMLVLEEGGWSDTSLWGGNSKGIIELASRSGILRCGRWLINASRESAMILTAARKRIWIRPRRFELPLSCRPLAKRRMRSPKCFVFEKIVVLPDGLGNLLGWCAVKHLGV